MKPIATAIVLIQLAREQLEQELWARRSHYATDLKPDDQDLADVVEDIGPILCVLESFSAYPRKFDERINKHGIKEWFNGQNWECKS